MDHRRPITLACVLLASGLASGCANVLGELDGLPLKVGLDQTLVTDAIAKAARVGWEIAGTLVVLLGLHCWYRASHGDPWISLLKEYLSGTVVAIALLESMKVGSGPVDWILRAGLYLGETFAPGDHTLEAVEKVIARYGGIVLDVVQKGAPSPVPTYYRFVEAWQYHLSFPLIAAAIAANASGIFLMRLILHVAFVWLVAFYRMIGPLAAPFVILPQTRYVFTGWLKTFIGIALWPWLFALAERLALAIPYSTWIGTELYTGEVVSGLRVILQGQLMFFALNVMFFFVYLGIPVAAHLLVAGAGRPFRGAIR